MTVDGNDIQHNLKFHQYFTGSKTESVFITQCLLDCLKKLFSIYYIQGKHCLFVVKYVLNPLQKYKVFLWIVSATQ